MWWEEEEGQLPPGPRGLAALGVGFLQPCCLLFAHRTMAARVGQLQEALNERHSVINALKAK